MSTQNFCFKNMLVAIEDEQIELFEECDKYSLLETLTNQIPEGQKSDAYVNDRNYGGKEIYTIDIYSKKDFHFCRITVLYRGGYYSGINLDYEIEEGKEVHAISKTETKHLQAKANKTEKLIRQILPLYGTELVRLGVFSNGEAVYKIKK